MLDRLFPASTPISKTAAALIVCRLPMMFGTSSEVMRHLAALMVDGMASPLVGTTLVVPVVYLPWKWRRLGDRSERLS